MHKLFEVIEPTMFEANHRLWLHTPVNIIVIIVATIQFYSFLNSHTHTQRHNIYLTLCSSFTSLFCFYRFLGFLV